MSDHWDVLKSLLPTYRAVTTAEVHDGRGTTFWLDAWNGDDDLATSFPALFSHVRSPEVSVRDVVDQGLQTMLVPRLTAEAERELAEVEGLLATLTLSEEPDKRVEKDLDQPCVVLMLCVVYIHVYKRPVD